MESGGIEINAALNIAYEGIVGPAIPQARHHVKEFACTAVTRLMLEMLVKAEIHRLIRIAGGDHVPSRASAAQVIERGEFPCDVIWLVVTRRCSSDESQMLGDDR